MVGLIIPLVVILCCSELILRYQPNDEVQSYRVRYKELFDHAVDAPILILGSSNSAHGIVPSVLKLTKPVFNFSFNGATCQFNLAFYRKYLKPHYKRPDYLIYALSPNSFSHFWRNIEDDVIYTPINKETEYSKFMSSWTRSLEVFKSTGIAKDVVRALFLAQQRTRGLYIGMDMRKYENGYLPYNSGEKFNLVQEQSLTPDPIEIAALHTLVWELKQDGVKIILVTLPSPDKQYRQTDLYAFDKTIEELAVKFQAPLIRANSIVPVFGSDYTLFNDEVHLTEKGANLFSNELGATLRELIKSEYSKKSLPTN